MSARDTRLWSRIKLSTFLKHQRYLFTSAYKRIEIKSTSIGPSDTLVSEWKSKIIKDTITTKDIITPSPLQLLTLTLDRPNIAPNIPATELPPIGTPLPPNYHLAYFPPRVY